jgi:hypothetical protein
VAGVHDNKCEISGSHGGEYEDDSPLGCCAVSETSVNFYETTRRSIPEGCHLRDNKPSVSIKDGEFRHQISDYYDSNTLLQGVSY